MDIYKKAEAKKSKASVNETWNNTHIMLVRDLEKKGTFPRYGVRHLKLWTDLIVSGRSKGVGDEPSWEESINEIGVPPKGRDDKQNKEKRKDKSDTTTNQLLQTIVLQNQAKNETFQNALLAMMNTSMTMLQVRFDIVMCEN
jgi:hypothetical protein